MDERKEEEDYDNEGEEEDDDDDDDEVIKMISLLCFNLRSSGLSKEWQMLYFMQLIFPQLGSVKDWQIE